MNYLAHFSFDEDDGGRFGYFTMVVAAKDADIAIDKFKAEIQALHASKDVFDRITEIYLDDIIEIRRMPDKAVLTRYESRSRDGTGSISTSVLSPTKAMTAFNWLPDGKEEIEKEEYEVYPFITFE